MIKCYQLTDESHQTYAAATFLNPTQRRDIFDSTWVGKLQPWVEVMLLNCRRYLGTRLRIPGPKKVSRKSPAMFGQGTIPEPSIAHIGKGVALVDRLAFGYKLS